MKLTMDVTGLDGLETRLTALSELPGIDDAVRLAAQDVVQAAQESLADGTPPESRTGHLAKSINAMPGKEPLTWEAGTKLAHGAHLEFGTHSRPARPWLGPAFAQNLPDINHKLRTLISMAIGGLFSGRSSAGARTSKPKPDEV